MVDAKWKKDRFYHLQLWPSCLKNDVKLCCAGMWCSIAGTKMFNQLIQVSRQNPDVDVLRALCVCHITFDWCLVVFLLSVCLIVKTHFSHLNCRNFWCTLNILQLFLGTVGLYKIGKNTLKYLYTFFKYVLWPLYGIWQAIIFLPCGFFLSSIFLFFLA